MSKATDYRNQFNRDNYYRIGLMIPKGTKELWSDKASRQSMSLNAFIQCAVAEYITLHSEEEK